MKEQSNMERVNRIWNHPVYQESLHKIQELEQERIFCRHDWQHFMDVARLAYIENLEQGLGISKEIIYAAALLHDIGRHLQYLEGVPHHKGGVRLAVPILEECGFRKEESILVLEAIGGHRDTETGSKASLAGLIYRADKASRCCFACKAYKECNWSDEKKNKVILA